MKIVTCIEKGRRFELHSPETWEVRKIKVDGEFIRNSNIEKCDYAMLVNDSNRDKHSLYFVELKGCDLSKAIAQLESTIVQLKSIINEYPKREAHAVCSRIIPCVQSSAQVKAVKFKKNYGFILKWHSQKAIVTIK